MCVAWFGCCTCVIGSGVLFGVESRSRVHRSQVMAWAMAQELQQAQAPGPGQVHAQLSSTEAMVMMRPYEEDLTVADEAVVGMGPAVEARGSGSRGAS